MMITAVIVTFQPDFRELQILLKSLQHQVTNAIVVDNGSNIDIESGIDRDFLQDSWCDVIRLPSNLGIAAAQNIGIEKARIKGANYVILFDQDSEPSKDMVERLLDAILTKTKQDYKVAAVGPRFIDPRRNNPSPFIRIKGLHLERYFCTELDSIVPVDFLIASGSMIPMATLDAVGGMIDKMFIDHVDTEWGMRAKNFGYQIFGVCNATMIHSLGDSPIDFLGRKVSSHSPLRHYYQFRNAVWLCLQPLPPWNWRLILSMRLLRQFIFYTLFAHPRFKHLSMMSLGIWHGLCGRLGPYKEDKN